MKFSVIIPVYNVERYVEKCIESVLNQTYDNYELILIDDGSTDKSGIICDNYKELYKKIVVLHTDNQGALLSRIEGVKKSKGDIIVFLDADDWIREDALAILEECFKKHHCDMVIYNAGYCDLCPTIQVRHPFKNETIYMKDDFKEVFYLLVSSKIPNAVWLKAIRRSCAKFSLNVQMVAAVKQGEDLLMSLEYIDNCEKIVFLERDIYFYRDRLESIVHTFDFKRKESVKIVHSIMGQYIEKWNVYELKPIHEARKIKGWLEILMMLINSRKTIGLHRYKSELGIMANDEYFRKAYVEADLNQLGLKLRLYAKLLYNKNYRMLGAFSYFKLCIKKLKKWVH